jgi:hypothetical protein
VPILNIDTPLAYEPLTAMITPAIFLTANASLIISTSNRMSRVVDRIRVLNDFGDSLGRGVTNHDYLAERLEHVEDQLDRMERRGRLIRFALTALYLALASFVGTSLTLAIDAIVNFRFAPVATALAVLGVSLLLFASVNLVFEALAALRSNRLEILFFRDLQKRRQTDKAHEPVP